MIDLESMIQSLRLAWIKRIFGQMTVHGKVIYDTFWIGLESFFYFILTMTSKTFLSHLNFTLSSLNGGPTFERNLTERDQQNIVWNSKEIRINNEPVFYKNFFESGIIYVNDLLFHLNNTDSLNIISKKISRINVLIWAGLRHSVPSLLKTTNRTFSTTPLLF